MFQVISRRFDTKKGNVFARSIHIGQIFLEYPCLPLSASVHHFSILTLCYSAIDTVV